MELERAQLLSRGSHKEKIGLLVSRLELGLRLPLPMLLKAQHLTSRCPAQGWTTLHCQVARTASMDGAVENGLHRNWHCQAGAACWHQLAHCRWSAGAVPHLQTLKRCRACAGPRSCRICALGCLAGGHLANGWGSKHAGSLSILGEPGAQTTLQATVEVVSDSGTSASREVATSRAKSVQQ